MRKCKTLVYAVGIDDSDYRVWARKRDDKGKSHVWQCPYHRAWSSMLRRCYSESSLKACPTYTDHRVCEEWLTFSRFKLWMEKQDWKGKELDKDLLGRGSKIYSPETCAFISRRLNLFLTGRNACRGGLPIGVTRSGKKFQSHCNNPFTGKTEYLGVFRIASEAHEQWRSRKHFLACRYADCEDDQRIRDALRSRFLLTDEATT